MFLSFLFRKKPEAAKKVTKDTTPRPVSATGGPPLSIERPMAAPVGHRSRRPSSSPKAELLVGSDPKLLDRVNRGLANNRGKL